MSLSQLSQLLPLAEEELQQVLDYASTLSKADAASHFSNLLGDSPLAVEFIAGFNSRRQARQADPVATVSVSANLSDSIEPVPRRNKPASKKKAAIHTPQARKVNDYAGPAGKAYSKKDSDLEYIPSGTSAAGSRHASRPSTPPRKEPEPAPSQSKPKPKPVTTAGGYLISDMPKKSKEKSTPTSRSSTPKPASSGPNVNVTKISISGGVPMAGQATALADLDHAIRSLEISTNPTLDNVQSRRCNCIATRHPLLAAAPNCLSCGKVICLKEGLGPCTFCGTSLLSSTDIQAMIRELKDERGREKMAANAAAHRKGDATRTPPVQPRTSDSPSLAEAAAHAREHRDKLLNFQANNAKRTTVHDEAADFDVSGAMAGTGSMWATPEERARELKRQQKMMREMEWNARPEYEKRQQIISIDLSGRRVIKTIGSAQRPATPEDKDKDEEKEEQQEEEAEESNYKYEGGQADDKAAGGAFSSNPLLGAAMRPIYRPRQIDDGQQDAKGKGVEGAQGDAGRRERRKGWRRMQDDLDDNEGIILDGGLGHADEPECG